MSSGTLLRRWSATSFAVAVITLLGTATALASPADEQAFVDMINDERRAAGAGPLTVLPVLVDGARQHAARMAAEGRIFHNPNLGDITDGWRMMGENVGRGGNIQTLHQAFMDSPGHRANILNPAYDAVGVGVVWQDGIPYVVEVFMDSIDGLRVQFTPPFADDDGSVHEADIIALYERGITRGCDVARYCPERAVSRGEMATMLVRAFGLTGTGDGFSDTEGSIHRSAISTLAANGITRGCAPGRFCPERSITRGEMATFLVRVLGLGPAPSAGFDDTVSSEHASAIDSLAAAGITRGCSPTSFCPHDRVTRGQLASFLIRALRHWES